MSWLDDVSNWANNTGSAIGNAFNSAGQSIGKTWNDTTGATNVNQGIATQAAATDAAKNAAAGSAAGTTAAQGQLGTIATNQQDYAGQQRNAQGLASELGQQAAGGAGAAAGQAARAQGMGRTGAAMAGAQQAGNAYGNTYGQNVQQGVSAQQTGLANAAGTTAQGAQLGQGQAGLGMQAAGQQAAGGAAQQATGAATQNALISGVGNVAAAATKLIPPSDKRLKNIKPTTDISAILSKIKPIDYNYKPGTGLPQDTRTGVIAQDVEKVIPQAVKTDPVSGMKGIDSSELSPVLLNLVVQLAAQVKDLQGKVGK